MWALTLWKLSNFFSSKFCRCPFIKIFTHQIFVPYGMVIITSIEVSLLYMLWRVYDKNENCILVLEFQDIAFHT